MRVGETKDYQVTRFTGINLNPDITQLQTGESPDMLNMVLDQDGTPDKRPGYTRLFDPINTDKVNGLFIFDEYGTPELIICQGNKVYSWGFDPLVDPALIFTGIADTNVRGFAFGSNLYLLDGTSYLVYDGTTLAAVSPYVPTVAISSPATGGGTAFEDLNLLNNSYKQSFNSVAGTLTYQLNVYPFHATTAITATVNGSAVTVASANRTLGTVTLSADPGAGLNNLVITAPLPDNTMNANAILKSKYANIYSGRNDSRVHVWGNPDLPSRIYRSGLLDPTYWPENGFSSLGDDSTAITAAVVQYETQVIFKQSSIYLQSFEMDGTPITGDPSFPTKPLNSAVGCVAPESLQLVDNNPVFLSEKGVMVLTSSQVRDERNVTNISDNIRSDFNSRTLETAISAYFDGNYILAFPTEGWCWVYNTKVVKETGQTGAWYPWDNIYARVFLKVGDELYFGTADGYVYKMLKMTDTPKHSDDGEAITGYITTKVFGYDAESYFKMLQYVHVTLRPQTSQSAVRVRYRTDKSGPWQEFETYSSTVFSYTGIVYSKWTYFASAIPTTVGRRLKVRRAVYYQFRFENDDLYAGIGILRLAMRVMLQRGVR